MTTDEATHDIVRILRRLHQDQRVMITGFEADWLLQPKELLRPERLVISQVRIHQAVRPAEAKG